MVDFVELPEFDESIAILERGEKVEGGTGGVANRPLQALVNRTRFLLEQIQGLSTQGIILIGPIASQEALDAIDTTGLAIGTAYTLDFALRVWNGTEWASSGSLRGPNGLNILGLWPDAVSLPEITENELGDAYLWRNDIWVLIPDAGTRKWEALGIRGPDGKSTYELWLEIPGNEGKTQEEFFESQRGPAGPSTFDTWLAQPGNAGKTEADFLEAQKGLQGEEGPARAAFVVDGTVAAVGDLVRPGDASKAYYIGVDLYVWVDRLTDYVKIPGVQGKSAFQIWQENGNPDGTLEEFLEDMKGYDGTSIQLIGPLDTQEELDAIDTTNLAHGNS